MGMSLMMIKACLVVCAFSVHESAGYAITLEVAASVLLHINGGSPGLRSQAAATVQSPKAQQIESLDEPSNIAPEPSHSSLGSPTRKQVHSPALSPSIPFHKHHYTRSKLHGSAPLPSPVSPLHSSVKGPSPSVSPAKSPLLSTSNTSPASAPSPTRSRMSILPPKISPMSSSLTTTKAPPTSPVLTLPPPPPNADCASVTCMEPLTYTPPGLRCGCVRPMQVKLRLSVALYTFFPLVSEFCAEIAEGVLLNQSQVRIVGANAASQQLEKTVVLMNLVPFGQKFNASTAILTYKKFWHKQVSITTSLFGDYEVVYVHYPGLPASPPSVSSGVTSDPFSGPGNSGMAIKPLGVDVPKRQNGGGLSRSTIAIIVASSFAVFVMCMGAAMLLVFKCGGYVHARNQNPHALINSLAKPSGAGHVILRSGPSSPSMSFASSILTYTGPTKTFTLADIERATNNFDASRILGEGGFGLVYSGTLDDGRLVAVKVLKRDDQQGGREFLAEVEMLSRLHHRNLVKLIGICTDDHARCLVYELIPNGSVESHLHGVDKENAPLDWGARMKIALGAARGLAYLHEDSSPRVIHRDFKSSNILLEHDFTPKVSDFGLARTALDEGNKHISTHVMGTFGYLAPEYAMTGHLLVKSDVYSYGVVLLELLTGRKPVDLSQPSGQENLVTWARPLLTSKDGLETMIDLCLGSNFPFDSVAKVAAIASMCVQPEVSHRPFMSEVVQALKLVCNEFDETSDPRIKKGSVDDFFMDLDARISRVDHDRDEIPDTLFGIRRGDSSFEAKIALSNSGLLNSSTEFESFRRHSSSGPLTPGNRRQFWQRLRGLSRGSVSEHGLWPRSR